MSAIGQHVGLAAPDECSAAGIAPAGDVVDQRSEPRRENVARGQQVYSRAATTFTGSSPVAAGQSSADRFHTRTSVRGLGRSHHWGKVVTTGHGAEVACAGLLSTPTDPQTTIVALYLLAAISTLSRAPLVGRIIGARSRPRVARLAALGEAPTPYAPTGPRLLPKARNSTTRPTTPTDANAPHRGSEAVWRPHSHANGSARPRCTGRIGHTRRWGPTPMSLRTQCIARVVRPGAAGVGRFKRLAHALRGPGRGRNSRAGHSAVRGIRPAFLGSPENGGARCLA